jgi:hypothetical protein
MRGVGVREWVALGVLGVAGLLGFLFFDPSSTDGKTDFERTTTVIVVPPGTPTPAAHASPSPTPVPVAKLGEPGGQWLVGYYESNEPGKGIRGGEGFVDNLQFDFEGRPFPDFKDDGWRLAVSQSMELAAGRYGFVLESDGALRVTAGEQILIDVPDSPQRQTHALEFDHKGGRVNIAIDLRDTGGPTYLHWAD